MRALTTLIMTVQAFHMQKPGSYAVLLDFGAISMLASDAGGNSAIARFGCSAARSWPIPPPPPPWCPLAHIAPRYSIQDP